MMADARRYTWSPLETMFDGDDGCREFVRHADYAALAARLDAAQAENAAVDA